MTKVIKVCITDEKSVPFNAPNSIELIEQIKNQINTKVETGSNLGVVNNGLDNLTIDLSKVAFSYSNPQIINGKLYVDLQILETPEGYNLKKMLDFRGTTVGVGIVNEDKSIRDFELFYVKVEEK